MGRLDIPKIEWNDGSAHTLHFGYPLDEALSWSEPRPGSERAMAPSGTRDAWITGFEPRLVGVVRWVPTSDGTTPAGDTITGWDGSEGWRAFLEFAREMNTFDFFPDKGQASSISSYLVEPQDGRPDPEDDGTRTFRIVLASEDGSEYTGY